MKKTSTAILLSLLVVLAMALSAACSGGDESIRPPAGAGENRTESGNTVTIEETVLYDAEGIKVTATGYEEGLMGPEIKLLVENSSSQNVLVTTKYLSVNGYMMPYSSLYAEVAADKKANESLLIMSSELEQAGIETVAELKFHISISDAESWETMLTSELITLSTSAAGLEQPVDDSGDILYDKDGIKVVCKGLRQDLIWDGTIVFFMSNDSGKPITVYAEDVSVNGFMQEVSLWSELRSGTKIVDGMSLLDLSELEVESIDEVESVEFRLRIINADNWDEIVTTDPITLEFN